MSETTREQPSTPEISEQDTELIREADFDAAKNMMNSMSSDASKTKFVRDVETFMHAHARLYAHFAEFYSREHRRAEQRKK